MPFHQVSPSSSLPHVAALIQRQGVPRFRSTAERDEQYTNPERGAMCAVSNEIQKYDGGQWLPLIHEEQKWVQRLDILGDVSVRGEPPDGAFLMYSSKAKAWIPTLLTDPGWCDTFERTDLGADWTLGPADYLPSQATLSLFTIDTGAAIGPTGYVGGYPQSQASMLRVAPTVADNQWIEATIENFTGSDQTYVTLFNFVDTTPDHTPDSGYELILPRRLGALWGDGSTTIMGYGWDGVASFGPWYGISGAATIPAEPFTLRFESFASGHHSLLLNGTSVLEADDDGTTEVGNGQQQGILLMWDTSVGSSPRILEICGGPL